MISTIMKINWLNLKRDKVALRMMFVLPVIFFSIFAFIFGATGRDTGRNTINVVAADLDQTEISRKFIESLQKAKALSVTAAPDKETARKEVHDGKYAVAVIIEKGFETVFGNFRSQQESVEVIYDASNPIAQNAVSGLLQAAAMMAAPDVLMEKEFSNLEALGAGMTPAQVRAMNQIRPYLRGERQASGATADSNPMGGMLHIRSTDVRAGEQPKQQYSMISYYAAGIGVMFLMFSMSGSGGALLDEQESGTLERVLGTNVSMSGLLLGKWLFMSILGIAQLTLMFLWAALVFHLDFFTGPRLVGFAAMAIVTAPAAAAFGLVLAALCRTRQQLQGLSSIVILIMSALGGSMVPRFVMPKFMEKTALFTLNGWALDGFLKIFWYDDPNRTPVQAVIAIMPQLAMLACLAAVFFGVARTLARRWDAV